MLTLMQKGSLWFVSLKVTPSDDRVLCVYAPSWQNTREQLVKGCFFERLQNYMEKKNERNKNKIMLGEFNFTMDKMGRCGGNKSQIPYRSCSNYGLSRVIVDNGFEDLWKRENPDSAEFTHYNGVILQRFRIDRIYTDIKIVKNSKNNQIMALILTDFPRKLKFEKVYGILIILFYVSLSSPQLQSRF